MEIAFYTMIVLLTLFAILALYDGFYLHIFKYKLFNQPESGGEHLTHTIRSILFPIILFSCYLTSSDFWFFVGLIFLVIDVLVTVADAYLEKDSRTFMGGLPRWEYIIHLLVNGLHFASIAVFIVIKVRLDGHGFTLLNDFSSVQNYDTFIWLVRNLIPGSIVMAVLHIAVAIPITAGYWNTIRNKISCC